MTPPGTDGHGRDPLFDPDDRTAQKLELALAESNLTLHEQGAKASLEAATNAHKRLHVARALAEAEEPAALAVFLDAIAQAATSSALAANVGLKLRLEKERRSIQHVRAHMDAEDAAEQTAEAAKEVIGEALNGLAATLREHGIQVDPRSLGGGVIGFGISSAPDDEA